MTAWPVATPLLFIIFLLFNTFRQYFSISNNIPVSSLIFVYIQNLSSVSHSILVYNLIHAKSMVDDSSALECISMHFLWLSSVENLSLWYRPHHLTTCASSLDYIQQSYWVLDDGLQDRYRLGIEPMFIDSYRAYKYM